MRPLTSCIVLVFGLVACSGAGAGTGSSSVTTATVAATATEPAAPGTSAPDADHSSTAPPTSAAPSTVPPALQDLELATIAVGDERFLVALADEPVERARGLMEISDLGELDGMLFVWGADTTSSFWMKDTLIDLDIAWFDAEGLLVGVDTMHPCDAEPCPRHSPGIAYRFALEAPRGALGFVDESTALVLDP